MSCSVHQATVNKQQPSSCFLVWSYVDVRYVGSCTGLHPYLLNIHGCGQWRGEAHRCFSRRSCAPLQCTRQTDITRQHYRKYLQNAQKKCKLEPTPIVYREKIRKVSHRRLDSLSVCDGQQRWKGFIVVNTEAPPGKTPSAKPLKGIYNSISGSTFQNKRLCQQPVSNKAVGLPQLQTPPISMQGIGAETSRWADTFFFFNTLHLHGILQQFSFTFKTQIFFLMVKHKAGLFL